MLPASRAALLPDDEPPSINTGNGGGVELRAFGVIQTVRVRRRNAKVILDGIDGTFSAGNLTALMGPSGSGKTSLLTVLRAGRCTSGHLTMNGHPYTRRGRKLIVTVPQDDVLLAGLTALEMLMYTAHLVLPQATSKDSRLARVRAVLTELNLCGDDVNTRIGSVDNRGLSGGQRKRVSIGLELLTNPSVLLCDEPTSGLDAKMAADVVAILRALSRRGRTVVATIHQPSFKLYSAFDALLLLSAGRAAFCGATADAAKHFASCGFPTPPHENPADYMMRLLQDSDEARGVDLPALWAVSEAAARQRGAPSLIDASSAWEGPKAPSAASAGFVAQTRVLLRRTLWDAFKDPSKVFKVVCLKSMVGLLTGSIWFGQGRSGSFGDIFSISGALFMCVTTATLEVLLDTVLEFPLARALLMRELANGHYSLPSYYASRTLANLCFACFNTMLVAVPVYLMVGLNMHASKFGIFAGCLVLLELIGSCIGILVGSNARDINDARTTLLPTLAPLLIFSGYVVPKGNIPIYFEWAYYASFFQYAFGLLMVNELGDRYFEHDCPAQLAEEAVIDDLLLHLFPNGTPPSLANWTHHQPRMNCTGHTYLAKIDMWPVPYGGLPHYFAILAAYLVASLIGAYAMLRWKTRAVVE